MKHSTAFVVAALLMAVAFAGVVAIADNEVSAETDVIISVDTVDEFEGKVLSNKALENELSVDGNKITGIVKSVQDPTTKEYTELGEVLVEKYTSEELVGITYFYVFTLSNCDGKYITFVALDGKIKNVELDAGKVTILAYLPEKAIDKEAMTASTTFEYAISDEKQSSLKGLITYTVDFEFTLDDRSPSILTWMADGIEITKTTTSKPNIPTAPAKENFVLSGWAVDGVTVITYNAGLVKDSDKGFRLAESVKFVAPEGVKDAGIAEAYLKTLREDTVLTAVFEPVDVTVEFYTVVEIVTPGEAGAEPVVSYDVKKVGETLVTKYGQVIAEPKLPEGFKYWVAENGVQFDFSKPILKDTKVYAIESDPVIPDERVFVYFEVDGEIIATYKAGEVTLPTTPVKEGYIFIGWAIGQTVIEDPVAYVVTESTTFVAVFTPVDVPVYTVIFVAVDGTELKVSVYEGGLVLAPVAAEGYFWNFDFSKAITEDVTIYEVPEKVTVTFIVGTQPVAALKQVLDYGSKYDMSALEGYVLPEPYIGWDVDLETAVFTKDTVVHAVEPEPVTPFFSTQYGYIVIFVIVMALIGLGYVLYKDMFGLKTKILGIKKKDKKIEPEAPVASDATGVQEKQQ